MKIDVEIYIDQWLSARRNFDPYGTMAISEDIWGGNNWRRGYHAQAKDAAKYRVSSTAENHPTQNFNSAMVWKPCHRCVCACARVWMDGWMDRQLEIDKDR